MSTALRAWLESHAADIPPSLAVAMEHAVSAVDSKESDVAALSLAALECLRTALRIGNDRAAAAHLLAADALLTAACEIAADESSDLHTLADDFAPARLAASFPGALSPSHS